ncbi:MAG: hypothetical protein B7Z55_00225 [Planctomycetales bacterium 12-60-4]|nr:MAG: hypothetical protein B7Z55_00225 [Planctomycetales bacterium 12-60-4]
MVRRESPSQNGERNDGGRLMLQTPRTTSKYNRRTLTYKHLSLRVYRKLKPGSQTQMAKLQTTFPEGSSFESDSLPFLPGM